MSVSLRDPSGHLFLFQDEPYRLVYELGDSDFQAALDSQALVKFVQANKLTKVYIVEERKENEILKTLEKSASFIKEESFRLVKHERIPFRSYPYEWCPEAMRAAGLLTLDLAQNLLSEGMGLKDASPYNVLFRGSKPVFVDWLSFEKRDEKDPIWLAHSQFTRNFCLPLLANEKFGIPLSWIFRTNRDGLEPETLYKMSGFAQKLQPSFLSLVTIPKMLAAKSQENSEIYQPKHFEDAEKARFVLSRQFSSLEKTLTKIKLDEDAKSNWTDYVGEKQHFTDEYLRQKEAFVREALAEYKPKRVLDVGCNTGYFSRIAAQAGASVVATDQDPVVVSKVWRMAERENLDVLPLVVDFARPTPAIGWRNRECPSFIERMRGRIDSILLLAVIHHLLVSERIPLDEIIDLAAEISNETAIMEFAPPEDPMFRRIARGRDYLFADLNSETFRAACEKRFRVVRSEKLPDSEREIYLLEKK